jgi:hypothetical protein
MELLETAADGAKGIREKLAYVVLQYLVEPDPARLQRIMDIAGSSKISCMELHALNIDAILLAAEADLPPRSAGGRRLLLSAAMREEVPDGVRNAIRNQLLSADGLTLNDAALADIAGFASPHEILTAIGVRARDERDAPAPND